MPNRHSFISSSIGKKQIVAITGLLLILFVIGHLVGNFILFLGEEAFNNYAKKIEDLRPGFYIVEFGLALVFLLHVLFTALVVIENIQARPEDYRLRKSSEQRSLATRIMPYTGTFLFVFIVVHIYDFTLIDKTGPRSIMPDGHSAYLYGVVYNAFTDQLHSAFYILAMMCVGFHLTHGIQSVWQTFGFDSRHSVLVKNISAWTGFLIAIGFISIPLYVMLHAAANY